MSEAVNASETVTSERRHRLADGVALGLLGGYLILRTITGRLGLGLAPRLLGARPWTIPLLNNSSLLLLQAGTGTEGRRGMFIATVATSVLMSTVAALVFYWAGWRFGHRLAELAAKPGSPWAGVWNPKQIARAERWMDSWGVLVVFFGRVVEWFTLPVMLVAGASAMRLRRFLVAHSLGAVAYATLFLWLGGVAQSRWPWLRDWISDVYGPWALRISIVLLGLVVVLMLVGQKQGRRQEERTAPSQGPSSSSETS